jgi:mannosylfructose-phosphate synthase
MYEPTPKLIMIWIRGDVTAAGAAPADAAQQAERVLEQSRALVRLGYEVELWTRRCADRPETEVLARGVPVRRFACGDCGCVREPTPCEYVAEFVTAAAEVLAPLPPAGVMLVSHSWDAGIAAKLLAARFGVAHVHVPHALGVEEHPAIADDAPAARDLTRRVREERETCRAASRVIASTPAQRDLLVGPTYGVPPTRVVVAPLPVRTPAPAPATRATTLRDLAPLAFAPAADLHLSTPYERPLGVESRLEYARSAVEDSIL